MNNLQMRWKPDQIASIVDELKSGIVPQSPFGITENGLIDLRGINIDTPVVINGLTAEKVDLSYSDLNKLLCIKCTLSNWVFNNTKLTLLNNGSRIYKSSFDRAKLTTSGSTGAADFEECNFVEAELIGGAFKEGRFLQCEFSEARLEKVEFGSTIFERTKISGYVEDCFLRGEFKQCDLTDTVFMDCAFYGALFIDCLLSEHCIVIENWSKALELICSGSDKNGLSPIGKQSLQEWCDAWSELTDFMVQNLIDYRYLVKSDGENVADELFSYFKIIKQQVD